MHDDPSAENMSQSTTVGIRQTRCYSFNIVRIHPITEANNNLHTPQLLTSESQALGYADWLHRDHDNARYVWMDIKLAYSYNEQQMILFLFHRHYGKLQTIGLKVLMKRATQSRSHSTSNQVTTINLDGTRQPQYGHVLITIIQVNLHDQSLYEEDESHDC
ncbi:hypothetical protein BC941DRAFT_475332 [Chlamydoabsidia padenii]|nr:hypothetical protein BC941DRAFT_475332 [Chlamydoabsidia padenii]